MNRFTLLLCGTMLASAPIAHACSIQIALTPRPDGNSQRLTWTPVPGATQYDIFESARGYDFRRVDQVNQKAEPAFIARPNSTETRSYSYLVVARSDNSDVSCVGTTSFEMRGDDKLAALAKRIVPLVGSVRGAFGSDFRTSLLLRYMPSVSGRIVFRPTGTLPSASDPSLPYAFSGDSVQSDLYWDDVIAAMGASGTGTLEIIPNAGAPDLDVLVPEVVARVYNVTPQGTFGSRVPSVHPGDWARSPENNASYWIPPSHGNYRRNAGIRTITTLLYRVAIRNSDGTTENVPGLRELPANYTWFGSVEALAGRSVPADATVFVGFVSGNAIGFYTETENSTNDPSVVIKDPTDVENVASWSY